jgi:hypothetical protein
MPITLIFLAAWAPGSIAACPQNQLGPGGSGGLSSLPVDSWNSPSNTSYASYNVPAGSLGISFGCAGGPGGECGSSGGVYVEDDFSIVGLPAGTPVSITAHLIGSLSGGGGGFMYAYVNAILSDANGNAQNAQSPPTTSCDLALPVQAIAGQPFRLHFELNGGSLGPVSGSGFGTFSFTGLPPGTAVTSCQGYASSPVVSARHSTWGKLKTVYR